MKAAIMAAGKGNRLSPHFNNIPKALIPIGGKTLIEWLLINLQKSGFTEVIIIARDVRVQDACLKMDLDISVDVLIRKTKGALYSFLELNDKLYNSHFGLFTVDTFAHPSEFLKFSAAIVQNPDCDFLLGITEFIQDETPVGVLLDEDSIVTGIGKHIRSSKYVASGMYYCSPSVWQLTDKAIEDGISHFSDFMGYMVTKKFVVKHTILGKVLDIDTKENVIEAIQMIENSS